MKTCENFKIIFFFKSTITTAQLPHSSKQKKRKEILISMHHVNWKMTTNNKFPINKGIINFQVSFSLCSFALLQNSTKIVVHRGIKLLGRR
jgi:hypothetical protein